MLERIICQKRLEVEESKRAVSEKELVERVEELGLAQRAGDRGAFLNALAPREPMAVIAEIKKASPSKGLIRKDFDPVAIARSYEKAGAAAISVLTDWTFFGGSLRDLTLVRSTVSIPVLRKDFIIDRYQLLESRAAGADAVLLIAAVLGLRLVEFVETANELGLDALVETHTREELLLALASGARIIGINNRDLRTFEVSLQTTLDLAPLVPADRILVSESGVRDKEDLIGLAGAGVRAALVGETLMRAGDPGEGLRQLLGGEMRPGVG